VLVDTNVVAELIRKHPDPGVLAWFSAHSTFALSVVTLDELAYGVACAPHGRRAKLEEWFSRLLAIPPRLLVVDAPVALAAGRLRAERERSGKPVTQADMLIAATACVRGLVLVTRNTRDFEGCGVALLNPFTK